MNYKLINEKLRKKLEFPDSLLPWIRIHIKIKWIRNTSIYSHGFKNIRPKLFYHGNILQKY